MPEPWQMLPGRSHRVNWANGRVNILLADSLGLMNRSTILCYEAIEFEPAPPAAILQFDHIRRILKEESAYAGSVLGVFGNAQQPVMVLPNLYFFSRGSEDFSYLDKTSQEVLNDFADFLGGPRELLVPAWDCLNRQLDALPVNLPEQLRNTRLEGEPAKFIPGGPERYVNILAGQVESRMGLLKAIAKDAKTDKECARRLADATIALVNWWKVHRYVLSGNGDEPFSWNYIHGSQVSELRHWCRANVRNPDRVATLSTRFLTTDGILTRPEAEKRIRELLTY
jgi:hypothetical protein